MNTEWPFQAVENNDGAAERHWRPVASWEEEYKKRGDE